MRKLNKREKILFISFGLVLILYLVSTYWITPLMENMDKLAAEREQLRTEWQVISQWVGKESALNETITKQAAEAEQLKLKIPPVNQSALYWDALNRLALETGCTLIRIEEGKEAIKAGTPRTVTVAFSGAEASVMQFMGRLQTMSYVTAVKTGTLDYREGTINTTMQLMIGAR